MLKNKFFRYFPFETWLICIPSFILLIPVLIYLNYEKIDNSFISNAISMLVNGNLLIQEIIFILLFALVFVLFKLIKYKNTTLELLKDIKGKITSIIFWVAIFSASTFVFINMLSIIMRRTSKSIAVASQKLLNSDIFIFKTYPSNTLNQFFSYHPILGKIAIFAYASLPILILLTIIVLLFTSTQKFRLFFSSYILIGFIGLVFWYFIPATSPRGYIDVNITHSQNISILKYKATPASTIAPFLSELDKTWIDPKGEKSNISTFPSMHAAWGFLIMYSFVTISPILGIIFIPWFLALSVGAIAIYQHFVVDIIAGIIIEAVIIVYVNNLLKKEYKYFEDKYSLLYFPRIFENFSKNIMSFIKNKTS